MPPFTGQWVQIRELEMATTIQPQIFEEIAEFLATFPTRDQVLAFRPRSETQERARELLLKSSEGELTTEERDEMADFGRAELFVRMLKARL